MHTNKNKLQKEYDEKKNKKDIKKKNEKLLKHNSLLQILKKISTNSVSVELFTFCTEIIPV